MFKSFHIYIYIYIYIYIIYIYIFWTFSSNLFFFKDLLLSTPWVQSNFFLPIMIKGIPMNSICLGRSFTLTSSNNDLWVLMFKDKKYCKVFESIVNTSLLSLSSFQACKYTYPCRKFVLCGNRNINQSI